MLSPTGALLDTRTLGPGTKSIADLKLDGQGRVLALGAYAGATSDLYIARIVIP